MLYLQLLHMLKELKKDTLKNNDEHKYLKKTIKNNVKRFL